MVGDTDQRSTDVASDSTAGSGEPEPLADVAGLRCPICRQVHDDLELNATALCRRCRTAGNYPRRCAVCGEELPRKFVFDRHRVCRPQLMLEGVG